MTKPTQPTLEQLYASASAVQAPAAPPNISAAILQAAHAQAASVSTVEVATAMPPAKIWQPLVQTLSKLKVRLQAAFDLPSVRYGLPAMMVAVVGIKVAITDVTKNYAATETVVREEVSAQVNTQVSPQAMPQLQTHDNTTAKVATREPIQTQTPTLTTPIAAQTNQTASAVVTSHAPVTPATPAMIETPITVKGESAPTAFPNAVVDQKPAAQKHKDARLQGNQDGLGTYTQASPTAAPSTAPSADTQANNLKTRAQNSVDTNPKVAGYPNHSSATQARVTNPAVPSPMPAERSHGLAKDNAIHPTEQLRLSIATTSINNGTLLIKCQPTPPLPAQVQALLAAGADPHHAWADNSVASAVRLAQHCGFTEAVAALLAFGKTP